jgi:hypothetical protein
VTELMWLGTGFHLWNGNGVFGAPENKSSDYKLEEREKIQKLLKVEVMSCSRVDEGCPQLRWGSSTQPNF